MFGAFQWEFAPTFDGRPPAAVGRDHSNGGLSVAAPSRPSSPGPLLAGGSQQVSLFDGPLRVNSITGATVRVGRRRAKSILLTATQLNHLQAAALTEANEVEGQKRRRQRFA